MILSRADNKSPDCYKGKCFKLYYQVRGLSLPEQLGELVLYQELFNIDIMAKFLMEQNMYYPLSHPQKRIWVTELMNSGTSFANLSGIVTMPEPIVDLKLLERAINLVIQQYDSIRLRLVEGTSYEAKQYFSNYKYKTFDVITEKCALEKSREPFTLINHDLYYFALFKNSSNRGGYYFKYHHIMCDALSVSLLNKEICAKYNILAGNQKVTNGIDNPSYVEFIEREQAYIQSQQYRVDEDFWYSEFIKPIEPLAFNKNNQKITLDTDRMIFNYGRDTTDKIHKFCSQHHTTLFRFFLSVFYVYLSSIYENEDLVVSIGHHNRINKREKQMVGMTVSTLPIRVTLKQDLNFLSFLQQVTEKVADCLSHQQFPFELLASHLRLNGLEPNHLMDVTINQIPSLTEEYTVERLTPGADPAMLNIKINPNQLPKAAPIEIAIDYRVDFFTSTQIQQAFNRLAYLIDGILKNPKSILEEIDIIPPDEKRVLLAQSSGALIPYNKEKLIHQLLEEQANRTPDNLALVSKDVQYSYAKLNEKTNQLARLLRKKGIEQNSFVAIMIERSCEYVIGIIAILKAGGAFVPIDPSLPNHRVKLILEDCKARLLLTHTALKTRASSLTNLWLSIDRINIYSDKSPLDNRNQLSDIAYLIYTSGSSGKPKGVMNTHGNLLNFSLWSKDFYQFSEADRHAAYCNFAFDVSIAELFPPLMIGSTVYIISDDIRLSIRAINEYFDKHQISVATLPTRVGELFMQEENNSLRILTVAGEKLNSFRQQNYSIVNAYGPTEATIYSTVYKIDKDCDNIPIGLPIANTWAYVVDNKGRLLPNGLAGELWLSGEHIARGYLNQPALTEKAFIVNPYKTGSQNALVYRTGDMVLRREDGNLEFLGRKDYQIKIRGYRIETSEIEKHLLENKLIRKAAVTNRGTENNCSLCAYIEGIKSLDLDKIKDNIRQNLPAYMIPDYLIQVPMIPMTRNGKTDYNALNDSLEGVLAKKKQGNKQANPKTATQKQMVVIWKNLLNTSKVNCTDSFFDLGGDSLSIMELSIRIQDAFNVDIPPHILYKENTIEKLSEIIECRVDDDNSFVVELTTKSEDDSIQTNRPIFCIHDITGELLSYRNLVCILGEKYHVYGIRTQKKNSGYQLSVEELAATYIDGIKSIQPNGPYSLIGYSSGGIIAFEMAQQLHQLNDKVILLALLDTPNYAKYPVGNIYLMAIKNVLPWLKDIPLNSYHRFAKLAMKKVLQVFFKRDKYSPSKIKASINRYFPRQYSGKLVLFRSTWKTNAKDQPLGWDGLAKLGVEIIRTKGSHITMMNIENSKQVAEKIIEKLEMSDSNG